VNEKVAKVLSDMLRIAQELAFELATEDDTEILNSPIAHKAREMVKKLKELVEIQKEAMSKSPTPTPQM